MIVADNLGIEVNDYLFSSTTHDKDDQDMDTNMAATPTNESRICIARPDLGVLCVGDNQEMDTCVAQTPTDGSTLVFWVNSHWLIS